VALFSKYTYNDEVVGFTEPTQNDDNDGLLSSSTLLHPRTMD